MNTKIKLGILFGVIVVMSMAMGYYIGFSTNRNEYRSVVKINGTDMYESHGVLITANHIPINQIPGNYTKVYSNKGEDTAYYINKNYVSTRVINKDVYVKGLSDARVVHSYAGYFEVNVSDPEDISSGMSGEIVRDSKNGRIIGFVSELLPGHLLKCISI
jgi:hypothetical protein